MEAETKISFVATCEIRRLEKLSTLRKRTPRGNRQVRPNRIFFPRISEAREKHGRVGDSPRHDALTRNSKIEGTEAKADTTCHSKSRLNKKKKKIPLCTGEEVDMDLSRMDNSPVLWITHSILI